MDACLDDFIRRGVLTEEIRSDFRVLTEHTESGAMWNPEFRLPLYVTGTGFAVESSIEFIFKQLVDKGTSTHHQNFVEDPVIDLTVSDVSDVESDDEMDPARENLRIESSAERLLTRSSEMASLGPCDLASLPFSDLSSIKTFPVAN